MKEFRFIWAKLAWISHSRPDISCGVAFASQVTEESLCEEDGRCVNKVIKHPTEKKEFKVQYQKLDESTLTISAYPDASFAGNTDFTSQLGMVIFLSDESGKCNIQHYGSYKDKRGTKAVLAGEIHAFGTAVAFSYLLQHDSRLILGQKIPIRMFTDWESLFDLVTKTSYRAEKRLMIDITCICDAFKLSDIDDV